MGKIDTFDGNQLVTDLQFVLGRNCAQLAHLNRFRHFAAQHEDAGKDQDGKCKIEDRACGNRCSAGPKRRAAHRAPAFGFGQPSHGRIILAAGGITVTLEFYITAKWQQGELPFCPAFIHP